jgi:hypothetical protein
MMKKFEINKVYQTRSPGDYDCVITCKIIARTDKTVTIFDLFEKKSKTFRLKIWNNIEQFRPWGSYSMCPVLTADREI